MWTNSYDLEQLGEFIRECRKEQGYRQDEFARRLSISHTTLSNLECGKNTSTETLQNALAVLGLRLVVVPRTAQVSVIEEAQ